MNTLITGTNTNNTLTTSIKKFAVIITVAASTMISVNANAENVKPVESAVSEFVVSQGKQMMNDLNTQLKASIDLEVKSLAASLLKHTAISKVPERNVLTENNNKVVAKVEYNKK